MRVLPGLGPFPGWVSCVGLKAFGAAAYDSRAVGFQL